MILTGLTAFFVFLFIYDLVKSDKPFKHYDSFDIGYLIVIACLALVCARTPFKFWQLENSLSMHASTFSQREGVTVSCTSVFDSIFDPFDISRAGTAYVETGEIIFHHGWCKNFMDYIDDPSEPSDRALFSMHVFTHEVMHIRGELNERKTDCQAIQRNHLLGRQLGVDDDIARRNAVDYYKRLYKKHPYFSKECAPGKALDENLMDSIWLEL
ncbi:hypothetical protein NBRC116583_06180 [Arenicella sp. 4NH20-0111]|uniref:hypothetical protein n=1 Tax=Arenicella sp. 4NH20-0111 TaxID=3127648 RepID=UPI003108519F